MSKHSKKKLLSLIFAVAVFFSMIGISGANVMAVTSRASIVTVAAREDNKTSTAAKNVTNTSGSSTTTTAWQVSAPAAKAADRAVEGESSKAFVEKDSQKTVKTEATRANKSNDRFTSVAAKEKTKAVSAPIKSQKKATSEKNGKTGKQHLTGLPGNAAQIVKEVNAHVGADAATSENISWITEDNSETKILVKDEAGNIVCDKAVTGKSNGSVYTYTVELQDLTEETKYLYTLQNGADTVNGQFKTAVSKYSDKTIRFAFLADPQVKNATTGKATGAVFAQLQQLSEKTPLDFVYIAGDHINKGSSEKQWQEFFHNGGKYPNATQNFLLQNTLLSTQGNHDKPDFNGHINTPDELGKKEFLKGVFSVDYGKVKFIMLNNASYNTTDLANNADFQNAVQFLRDEVAAAKANGMWTVVGFHKPLYTGASHIDDDDVIAYRKALNPVLTELDVDMVLSGHDHVYARGFVNAEGKKASVLDTDLTASNNMNTYNHVEGAPFHMVAEHAGGLKWYKATNYTVSAGDPLTPNYEFLDKNSAQESPSSAEKQEQTYVVVEITPEVATITAHKFKYDTDSDTITTEPYIYDQLAITKATSQELKQPKMIREVNAHVGADAATSENISWITAKDTDTKIQVKDEAGNIVYDQTVKGKSNGSVYTYTAELQNLTEETKYLYTLQNKGDSVSGQFKTAASKQSDKPIRFAFLADPQVYDDDSAEATGAIFAQLQQLSAKTPLDFIYIAGDHTNTGDDEEQWQKFFHNGGKYPNATQNFLLQNTLLSTQGNHDSLDFNGHINTPDKLGDDEFLRGVFSANYGKVRFIMLNNASYNTDNLASNESFQKAVKFLREEVADAKANGMWTIVGFHKPLYTGASHIDDDDVIAYRKALNPVLTELDVDMVLSGHDHVYARGFVNAEGKKASSLDTKLTASNNMNTYNHVKGAPFHMVAEHAGGLKWYKAVNYTVSAGDPLTPNYEFLDKNSAQENPSSADKKEQTYVVVEITPEVAKITAHKFKYDPDKDAIITEPYIYDQLAITKAKAATEPTQPTKQTTKPTQSTSRNTTAKPTQPSSRNTTTNPTQPSSQNTTTNPTQATTSAKSVKSADNTKTTAVVVPGKVTVAPTGVTKTAVKTTLPKVQKTLSSKPVITGKNTVPQTGEPLQNAVIWGSLSISMAGLCLVTLKLMQKRNISR